MKENITREIIKYLEMNENKIPAVPKLVQYSKSIGEGQIYSYRCIIFKKSRMIANQSNFIA